MQGWDTVEELHRGSRSALTRVRRREDGSPYVIKRGASSGALEAVEREERVLSVLVGCDGVVRSHGMVAPGALLLESFEGESLARRLLRGRILPANGLSLALSLLTTLGRVHSRGIVHGDLSAENVLLANDGSCRLIDFASAVPIGSDAPPVERVARSLGALMEAAPEQLGRQRRVDRRTDYYRLGALLYEVLTGKPLFEGVDPEELALTHATRLPRPPRELVPDMSPALERVLLKLLEKDPDARFQSEARLRDALECCRAAAQRGDRGFDGLSTDAEAPTVLLTDKLFGREMVLTRIERSCERALRGQRTVVVLEGPAGFGKSALAEEVGRRIRARQGHFVRIAFEADHAADPGLPLQRALEGLSVELERLAGPHLLALGERLERRFPGASSALVACCPALGHAFPSAAPYVLREGSVEPVPRAFGELLRVMSEQGPPVCLFIDDLQWAPLSAWHAVRALIGAAERAPIALLCAFRTDDADACARSRSLVAELTAHGYTLASERLVALGRPDVQKLLAASLTQKAADLEALEELLWRWSQGNPLSARALLEAMAQRCVAFDVQGRPYVELGRARALLAEGSVDGLLGQRHRALPTDTRHALELAACLGDAFDLSVLSSALGADALVSLAPGVSAGLLVSMLGLRVGQPQRGRFVHERARAVVLSGLNDEDRAARHLTLGRALAQRLSAGHDRHTLFAAIAHLDQARALLDDGELAELGALQLRGAREATRAGHADLAVTLASAACAALPADAWEAAPGRVRALLNAQADAVFLWGDHEPLAAILEDLHAHAFEPLQLAEALTLEGRIHEAQGRPGKAGAAYLQALSVLNASLGDKPGEREVAAEHKRLVTQLSGVPDDTLLTLGECRDERVRRELYLLGKLLLSPGYANEAQLAIAAFRLIRLGHRHGHGPESACGHAHYAALLARDQKLELAARHARIALELAERFGSAHVLAHVQLEVALHVSYLSVSSARLAPLLAKAHHAALAAGHQALAGKAANTLDVVRLWAGEPLQPLWDELNEHRELLKQFKDKPLLNAHGAWMQLVHQLREPTSHAARLVGPYYDEHERAAQRDPDDTALLLHHTLATSILAAVSRAPSAPAPLGEKLTAEYDASWWAVPLHALDALTRAMAHASVPADRRAREVAAIRAAVDRLARFAALNPDQGEPLVRLLGALEAERAGQGERAAKLLEEAVELAPRVGPLWSALASECAGRFWLARSDRDRAGALLVRARDAYAVWGAQSKLSALAREYPDLLRAPATNVDALDARALLRVVAATGVIASELRMEPLLERIREALRELAEADRVYVLLCEGSAGPDDARFDVDVLRRVLEHDAAVRVDKRDADGVSLLCVPLTRQAQTRVLVYMERDAERGPFGQQAALLALVADHVRHALAHARTLHELTSGHQG